MTLLEIMISMAVVLTGMLGMFKVLGASVRGSSAAQRFAQGQSRAQQVHEAIRTAPKAVLDCLVATASSGWTACETTCKAALVGAQAAQACVFVTLDNQNNQGTDRTLQRYLVVNDPNDDTRSTWVRLTGGSGRIYDAQITVGWNDDGTAVMPVAHRVTLRSGLFQ